MAFERRRGRAFLREAAVALDAAAAAAAACSGTLPAAIASARANLRRACSLDQEHGGAARAPAVAALVLAVRATCGVLPDAAQLGAALAMYTGHAVQTGYQNNGALPVALCAVLQVWSGRNCHVVCASDANAARDATCYEALFQLCGCSSAALAPAMQAEDAARVYASDVAYASARQLLSDFMRDQMLLDGATTPVRRHLRAAATGVRSLQSGAGVAIVADIEAVLADDASSPVLLSGAGQLTVLNDASVAALDVVAGLTAGTDYRIDAAPQWQVHWSVEGEQRLQMLAARLLPVYWRHPRRTADLVATALIARDMLERERHYVVQEGRVILTDENVMRLLAGRIWQQGPLQAVEAREQLVLSAPPRTIARAAFQSFFPRYARLSGAGSVLAGLEPELQACYGLPVVALDQDRAPRVQLRAGFPDGVAKLDAFVEVLCEHARTGRAVLASAPRSADLAAIGRTLAERAVVFQLVDGRDPAADQLTLAHCASPGRVTLMAGTSVRATGRSYSQSISLDQDHGARARAQLLLFEHWDIKRADQAFFAWGDDALVFAARDELAARPLPFWALWLRTMLLSGRLAQLAAATIIRVSQWHLARHGGKYRKAMAGREIQLDEQLAFSRKA